MKRRKPWSPWSPDEHTQLVELSRQGMRPIEIAEILGRSVAVVNKKRLDLGLVVRGQACEVCGGPIEQCDIGRPRRICSTRCQSTKAADKRNARLQERIEARTDWTCLVCGAPLPKDRPSRKYCKSACNKRAWYERSRAAGGPK